MESERIETNIREIFARAMKYLIQGIMVAIAARYIPTQKLDIKEIIMLGITAALTFAILDTFAPAISRGAKMGAGLSIGSALLGGIKTI